MTSHYDVIVVGAGAMGMAAGYFLSREGLSTLLLDAHDPPHKNGSHHGDTRIIRHAYTMAKPYVPLAIRAHELWSELEECTGSDLFRRTGVLRVGPADSADLYEQVAMALEFGLNLEALEAAEIQKRWPGIQLPHSFAGNYEPDAGVLFSERCVRAYRKMAEANGANLLTDTIVNEIIASPNKVKVVTAKRTFHAEKVIVSAGAWASHLLSSPSLPLQVLRKTVGWFGTKEELFHPGAFPAFIVDVPSGSYYGFPSFDGTGLKIGRHDGGRMVHPDFINRQFGMYKEDEGDVRHFLECYMPKAAGPLKQGAVCMYTMTPDEHFIVDRHPEHNNIVIAAGFSGHGFKFASAIGETLSQLAIGGSAELDLSIFSINRFKSPI